MSVLNALLALCLFLYVTAATVHSTINSTTTTTAADDPSSRNRAISSSQVFQLSGSYTNPAVFTGPFCALNPRCGQVLTPTTNLKISTIGMHYVCRGRTNTMDAQMIIGLFDLDTQKVTQILYITPSITIVCSGGTAEHVATFTFSGAQLASNTYYLIYYTHMGNGAPYPYPAARSSTDIGMVGTPEEQSATAPSPYSWGSSGTFSLAMDYTVVVGGGSDPIITGFDGKTFDFKGEAGKIFNMFSLPDLQINAYFIEGNSPDETYMGKIGIKQGDKSFISLDLDGAFVHSATKPHKVGTQLVYPMASDYKMGNGGSAYRPSKGSLILDWPMYRINLTRIFEQKPNEEKEIVYIDFTLELKITPDRDSIHGVVGHTYVHRESFLVQGYYDGHWKDYAAIDNKDIFTSNFIKNCKYDPYKHVDAVFTAVPQIVNAFNKY